MSDIRSKKMAVEIAVDKLGLDEAENRIRRETVDGSDLQLGLLGHARKYADKREVAA